ncbi:GemA protein [Alloyangia pacifica]|uniref:GemA protein n=1 Tax=Alloyangia pacifica TaxID=311180 RepID=A0A2U8HAP0_9RHOB|nr:regulatory protein GemA [Alloyangia pacifica]AWI83047.1 GemA protein [Alloyangia pacifica]
MTRSLQRMIHVGCRELGLDSEARRGLQLAVTGKASLSQMNEAELKLVVNRLKQDGFKPEQRKAGKRKPAPRADLRLIHVIWRKLGEAGELERPDRAGLNAFIRVRFEKSWGMVPADVDMLREWQQIDDVLQALMSWGKRASIDFDWSGLRK